MARIRIVKDAEARRGEIIAAATRLFLRDGYDATSVNAIIAAVGLSKGAFYHHFQSKEEVMQAMARQFAEQMRARVEPLLERADLSPLDKLKLVFRGGAEFKKEHVEPLRAMTDLYCRDENLRLRRRLVAESIAVVGPLYVRIFDEGQRDGTFDIEHPVETARLLLHLGTLMHDVFAEGLRVAASGKPKDLTAAIALVRRQVDAFLTAQERILGLAPGALAPAVLVDDELYALFLSPRSARRPEKDPGKKQGAPKRTTRKPATRSSIQPGRARAR